MPNAFGYGQYPPAPQAFGQAPVPTNPAWLSYGAPVPSSTMPVNNAPLPPPGYYPASPFGQGPPAPGIYPSLPQGQVPPVSGYSAPISFVHATTTNQPFQNPSGTWVPASGKSIPPGAFEGGRDHGSILYIGRAQHQGLLIPGKVQPDHGVCYVPYGGQEHGKQNYEIFVGSGRWVAASDSNVPPNAISAGTTENGEPLYVGRAEHKGTLTVGKVQKSHGCCYIPYGGKEISKNRYEVLVF